MTFVTTENQFKEIRPGDKLFLMSDGIKLVPRASLEISLQCPDQYKSIIADAFNKGWIKPVAHLKTTEVFWENLRD